MNIKTINDHVSISEQIAVDDLASLANSGVEIVVCNRPDDEAANQVSFDEIQRMAAQLGLTSVNIPFKTGELQQTQIDEFAELLGQQKKIHAYCRTGNRSSQIWALAAHARGLPGEEIVAQAAQAGFDVAKILPSTSAQSAQVINQTHGELREAKQHYDIVVVGAGSGGIAVTASLRKRNNTLRIVLIDPAKEHYYQPGWTMVGGGVFSAMSTQRQMKEVIPSGVAWINDAVVSFFPDQNLVHLKDGQELHYEHLIIAPGLKLDWAAVEGLNETLGKNGVTSNYRYDLAPYTWKLVQELSAGNALFTQPPMPIKCAGAPQKALYLSADYWFRNNNINNIEIHFYNAGGVLFGVSDYVPALNKYIEKYGAQTHFLHNLKKVDGQSKTAWFESKDSEGKDALLEKSFDFLHVCPPQCSPDFIHDSSLSDNAGWLEVNPQTLRHQRHSNIWGLGDCLSTGNAKTMAAVRKQVPVVADNICSVLKGDAPISGYEGYGSCPLTVERGKIVLAEFKYGGQLDPTFPGWVNEGTRPSRFAWWLKASVLPGFYWHGMLKGREWLAKPKKLPAE